MKRVLAILILIPGLALLPTQAFAQSIRPIIDFMLPDPDLDFEIGETIDIYVHVKIQSCTTNQDTAITGNLLYWYQTDSMELVNPNNFDSIDADQSDEYIPQGGKMDTIPFYCDSTQLRTATTGPVNVIIIWPSLVAPGTPLCDSLPASDSMLVLPAIGIEEEIYKFGSTVYPNPSAALEVVFLNSKYTQPIQRINIMNSMGQELFLKQFFNDDESKGYVLPTQNLLPGVYHIRIVYKDKKSEIVKFIKN